MPRGIYKRKPFTPEHCAALSKAQTGENNSMFGKTHSLEHCAKVSKAMMGVPKSPEACANMSKAQKGVLHTTPAQIAANKSLGDMMRGGNDMVEHHMIYDHSDLSKNIMKMTRSMHMRLHQLFRKRGISIPHINKEV